MAWTSPPVFTDATILSATNLNILSDDLAHLYGLLQAATAASASLYTNQNLNSGNNAWKFRYRHRYLHYRAVINSNTMNLFQIVVNGSTVFTDANTRSIGYAYASYVDLNALGLTSGTIYTIFLVTGNSGAGAALMVEYFINAEGTTL